MPLTAVNPHYIIHTVVCVSAERKALYAPQFFQNRRIVKMSKDYSTHFLMNTDDVKEYVIHKGFSIRVRSLYAAKSVTAISITFLR